MSEKDSADLHAHSEIMYKPPTVDPRKYYGSVNWVREILIRVGQTVPESVELVGLPQIGKTTLLRFVASPEGALTEPRYRTMLSAPFNREPHRLFFLLVEFKMLPEGKHPFVYLYERFHEEYPKYRERTQKQFQSQEWELPEFKPEDEVNQTMALPKLVEYFNKLNGIRPVFLFDDFDYVFFKDKYLEQAIEFRPWSAWASFILANRSCLSDINPVALLSDFYNLMFKIRLNGLTRNEAEVLISDMFRSTNCPTPAEDMSFVFEQAGGHPQLIIRAVKILWAERHRSNLIGTDEPLSREHRAHLTILLHSEFYRFFNLYWENLNENEQAALGKLVRGQKWSDAERTMFAATFVHRGLVTYDEKQNVYRPFSRLFTDYLSELLVSSAEQPKLDLTGIEASLHQYLCEHPKQTCTFDEMLKQVWSYASNESGEKDQLRRRMQVAISRLRTKLKNAGTGEDIINIRDVGYLYIPETS